MVGVLLRCPVPEGIRAALRARAGPPTGRAAARRARAAVRIANSRRALWARAPRASPRRERFRCRWSRLFAGPARYRQKARHRKELEVHAWRHAKATGTVAGPLRCRPQSLHVVR